IAVSSWDPSMPESSMDVHRADLHTSEMHAQEIRIPGENQGSAVDFVPSETIEIGHEQAVEELTNVAISRSGRHGVQDLVEICKDWITTVVGFRSRRGRLTRDSGPSSLHHIVVDHREEHLSVDHRFGDPERELKRLGDSMAQKGTVVRTEPVDGSLREE